MRYFLIIFFLELILLLSCQPDNNPPIVQVESGEQYPGGSQATTFDFSENAFGIQVKGMTAEQEGFFVTGNSFFRSNWVTAPGSVQTLDGLGPLINDISCGSCHFKDGRAQPPGGPGETLRGLLFRLSIPGTGGHGEPLGDPVYGGQFQDKSIASILPEGQVRVTFQDVNGQYADGSSYSIRQPIYEFHSLNYGNLAPGWMFSPRIAQQLPGLGLLEIVPESVIVAFSDEFDTNADGISGRPNYVWDVKRQQATLGRFGWKANQPTLKQQTAGAFNGDIGITTNLFPHDHLTPVQLQQYPNIPNGGQPELSDETLRKVVSYLQSLAVPARRDYDAAGILRGKSVFTDLNCSGCHRPQLITGDAGDIAGLKNQAIWPYTDLLLHDMGAALGDGRPDYLANGTEWRTPPLWGVGLIKVVNNHTFLLHDGRARNVEEAILWHGGEGEASREAFKNLTQEDRLAVIKFVESL